MSFTLTTLLSNTIVLQTLECSEYHPPHKIQWPALFLLSSFSYQKPTPYFSPPCFLYHFFQIFLDNLSLFTELFFRFTAWRCVCVLGGGGSCMHQHTCVHFCLSRVLWIKFISFYNNLSVSWIMKLFEFLCSVVVVVVFWGEGGCSWGSVQN